MARKIKPLNTEQRLCELELPVLRATLAVVPFATAIDTAQRAAATCPKAGTASGLAHLIRNCPEGVNPFAAPAFFSTLFRLWKDLKLDAYGRDPKPSFVANFSGAQKVRFSSATSRREFNEILAAIKETVPQAEKGRAPVGVFEINRARQLEKQKLVLAPMLESILEDVGRPTDYPSRSAFEAAIRDKWTWPALHEAAETLWDCCGKRGLRPLHKAARRLAEVLRTARDARFAASGEVELNEIPPPRKRKPKS